MTQPLQPVVEAWNQMARNCQARGCRHLNEERCRKLAARLKNDFWKENWREGLEMVPDSPFLNGENGRGWKANFDWFIRLTTLDKLLEGQYSGRPPDPPEEAYIPFGPNIPPVDEAVMGMVEADAVAKKAKGQCDESK